MWSTPSSTARRRTARAASGSLGAPNTRGPASCIAPKPMRLMGLSPRNDVLVMGHRVRLSLVADKKPADHVSATTSRGADDKCHQLLARRMLLWQRARAMNLLRRLDHDPHEWEADAVQPRAGHLVHLAEVSVLAFTVVLALVEVGRIAVL